LKSHVSDGRQIELMVPRMCLAPRETHPCKDEPDGRFQVLNEDESVPVFFYTGRRFPHITVCNPAVEDDTADTKPLYEVRIIDNDHNTYQEVIEIAVLALGISEEQAFVIAWEVDHLGSCVVAHAPKGAAEEIAGLIRTIGIEVQVNPINQAEC
jgi:ATP-dependent Clp protease adapter protein ClpS